MPKQLLLTAGGVHGQIDPKASNANEDGDDHALERESKKKKPTPENSAETVARSCREQ